MMEYNFSKIEKKWQKRWEKKKIFYAIPDKRKKFFINFPYPYINAYLHLGHGFSSIRVDVMARFKRMQGFNVFFHKPGIVQAHLFGLPLNELRKKNQNN